jgi:N-acetylglucosaminyldiphosphoundecaprenol N-acetyl-beta-D-mannosaminyltransferase
MAPASPDRLWLGGVPVDRVTLPQALLRIEALVRDGRGGAVFTPNVDHVVLAQRHPGFRAAYADADLSLADGVPIVWSSRLLRDPLPEKVSGSDLVRPLLRHAAALGWRVYLMGGRPGVPEEASRRMRLELPGLAVVGTDSPEVAAEGPDPAGDAAAERVRAARPDLVLVALGAPKQELWIHRQRARLGPAVAVGVGASLDFLAGRARRAPRWISSAGLEWLWRLGHDPRRLWRRYLVDDPRFALVLAREARDRVRARLRR